MAWLLVLITHISDDTESAIQPKQVTQFNPLPVFHSELSEFQFSFTYLNLSADMNIYGHVYGHLANVVI